VLARLDEDNRCFLDFHVLPSIDRRTRFLVKGLVGRRIVLRLELEWSSNSRHGTVPNPSAQRRHMGSGLCEGKDLS
jgi:hypothetical protein